MRALTFIVTVVVMASHAAAVPVDLSEVDLATPDFTDQVFTDGNFSTMFDGTATTNAAVNTLQGNAAGDLTTGGTLNAMVDYQLDFDDALSRFVITGVDGGAGSGPGTLGSSDLYLLTAAGGFTVDDPGNDDIQNLVITPNSVQFNFINGGPDTWTVTTNGPVSTLNVKFTNTAPGNKATINIQGIRPIPEPTTGVLAILAAAGIGLRRRRV